MDKIYSNKNEHSRKRKKRNTSLDLRFFQSTSGKFYFHLFVERAVQVKTAILLCSRGTYNNGRSSVKQSSGGVLNRFRFWQRMQRPKLAVYRKSFMRGAEILVIKPLETRLGLCHRKGNNFSLGKAFNEEEANFSGRGGG
ncbi:hypothetical protein TNIN_122311 [Trichonephila inaurata madagascariensis]|uniref:Uncharacterized protein n=1 Tax=Trichonephila inaurata madagascariensis TaxID=2747483 RepID=A0A8X7C6Q4_9ARAC|nr:hypothetical protein TNIN_122311 [Trichonephila inaurata madagascariensis]